MILFIHIYFPFNKHLKKYSEVSNTNRGVKKLAPSGTERVADLTTASVVTTEYYNTIVTASVVYY